MTDAHCHPTDLKYELSEYDAVSIGAIAAMATDVENQEKVKALGAARAWRSDTLSSSSGRQRVGGRGTSVISCFGRSDFVRQDA